MIDPSPESWTSRLLSVCVSILLGAMALWGAVYIVQSIWPYLVVLAFIVTVIGAAYYRFRRW